MEQKTYELMCKRIKAQGITTNELTRLLNMRLEVKVCEQEIMNYLVDPSQIPEDVEQKMKELFYLQEVKQMSMQDFGVEVQE